MKEKIKIGSDFTGVGSFDQALIRLRIPYKTIFACDMDKFARQTYIHNYGQPDYFPENVYDRKIPKEPLGIYATTPPCQAFSLAGKRNGEDDKRGILFYNSHEFIQKNKPRYFIFENVKGLLSSKSSITYSNSLYLLLYNFEQIKEWEKLSYQKNNLNLLGQSITNYLCLNYAKKLGLKKRTSDMFYTINSGLDYEKLEKKVKSGLLRRSKFLEERIYQITKKSSFYPQELTVPLGCKEEDLVLNPNQLYLIDNISRKVINLLEKTVGISANTSLFANNILEDNSKNGKLYTILMELNSIMNEQTFMYVLEKNIIRLIILALDLSSNLWKEIWLILTGKKEYIGLKTFDIWRFNLDHLNYHVYWKVLNAKDYNVPQNRERVFIVGIRDDADNGFNWPKPEALTKRLKDILEDQVDEKYFLSEKTIRGYLKHSEVHSERGNGFEFSPKSNHDILNSITTKSGSRPTDNFIKIKSNTKKGYDIAYPGDSINFSIPNSKTRRGRVGKEVLQTIDTACNQGTIDGDRIRKITPREAFRGMDFDESFSWPVSDSQAYKQAGNSVVVKMFELILKGLKL